jgi:hypothetical protein
LSEIPVRQGGACVIVLAPTKYLIMARVEKGASLRVIDMEKKKIEFALRIEDFLISES